MSFAIVWDFPALTSLYKIHWRKGAIIDAAVMRFAASRAAAIEPAPLYRLRVGGYDVVLTVDRAAGMVTVLRIYRMP
jgi:mRNA-degrading endonuclease RelE of RelBE toxin-antitoxin system